MGREMAREFPTLRTTLLCSKHESDRIAAAQALGDLGDTEATSALVAYFHDRYSGAVNEAAAAALARCGDPGFEALVQLLEDINTRPFAKQALASLDEPRATQAVQAFEQQQPLWREVHHAQLIARRKAQLAARGEPPPTERRPGEARRETLDDERQGSRRRQAGRSLRTERDKNELAVRAQAELLARDPTPGHAQQVGEMLRKSRSPDLCRWLAKLLSACGQPGVDALLALLDQPRSRSFVMGALRHSADERVWHALIDAKVAWLADRRARQSLRHPGLEQKSGTYRVIAPAADPGFVTYRDPRHSFSLTLPADSVVLGEGHGHGVWSVLFGDRDAAAIGSVADATAPMVAVYVAKLRSSTTTDESGRLTSLAAIVPGVMHAAWIDCELERESERVTVNGLPARRTTYVSGIDRFAMSALENGGRDFAIFAGSLVRDWNAIEPMLEQIVQTFSPTQRVR